MSARRDGLKFEEALEAGDLDALRRLLGDPPDFPNGRVPMELGGGRLLEHAIYHGPISLIRDLLSLGADPNYEDGTFPSLIAALSSPERGDMHEVLELLLEAGADVNVHGVEDNTPLHQAVWLDDPVALSMLISHGAHLTERRRVGDCATPLEEARRLKCRKAVEVLEEALAKADSGRMSFPADPSFPMPHSLADLHREIDAAFTSRPHPGAAAVARFLQGGAMDPDALPALLKLALEVSGPVDAGDPLLFHLGRLGNLLIPRLHPAEKQAVAHVMEYLSAEYERRGYTVNPARRALDDVWADLPVEELKKSRNPERIHAAFRNGDLATLQAVLEGFPDCEVPRTGATCLEHAIRNSPLSLIRALVDSGAELHGRASLVDALANPHPEKLEILEYLISLGADLNQRDAGGRTPLHWAAVLDDPAAIDLLVSHGADLQARAQSDDSATPLELARKHAVPVPEAVEALERALRREDRS